MLQLSVGNSQKFATRCLYACFFPFRNVCEPSGRCPRRFFRQPSSTLSGRPIVWATKPTLSTRTAHASIWGVMSKNRSNRPELRASHNLAVASLCLLACVHAKPETRVVIAAPPAVPAALTRWMEPQRWVRDRSAPVLALGASGSFDDMHIFAPCVNFEQGRYQMYYCGSRHEVAKRLFRLGRAESHDGRYFVRTGDSSVFEFGDGEHSVLTPALLRRPDGSVLREDGKLRLWFSATRFAAASNLHTLHETSSEDGIHWREPSPPLAENVYAPSVLKDGGAYKMWYVDVAAEPWILRYAESRDGRRWDVESKPVLTLSQSWEKNRLFYPTVRRVDGAYLMWYGSYNPPRRLLALPPARTGRRGTRTLTIQCFVPIRCELGSRTTQPVSH